MMESTQQHGEGSGRNECLVCFAPLGGGRGFAHVLHQGEMANFCSLECLEIFQNNPASFLKRMKPSVRKVPGDTQHVNVLHAPVPERRKAHGA